MASMVTTFSKGSLMCGISFHVKVGVVPQFDSCRSTDGRCSVGSPNAAVFLKLGQTSSTSAQNDYCLSLLGAISPCPTVNAALCPRSSSTLPSPSRVHNRPIVSHFCCSSGVLHSTTGGIGPLSLLPVVSKQCFRLTRHSRLVAAASSLSVWYGPSLPLARTRLSVDALAPLSMLDSGSSVAGLTTRFQRSGCEAPGALIVVHSGRSFLRLFLQLFVGMSRLCRPSRPVVSCVLPNSTLHSARLIPRPYLVCWAGLRAFCLAVTISSRFPGSLFQRQEGEDCRKFFWTNPSPATSRKSGHATKCQDHQLCQECCDCSCG